MGKPGSLLSKLTPTYAAGLTLVAMLGFGWSGRGKLAQWIDLPDTVESHGDVIVLLTEDMADVRRAQRADSVKIERIACLVTAMARQRDPVEECGL